MPLNDPYYVSATQWMPSYCQLNDEQAGKVSLSWSLVTIFQDEVLADPPISATEFRNRLSPWKILRPSGDDAAADPGAMRFYLAVQPPDEAEVKITQESLERVAVPDASAQADGSTAGPTGYQKLIQSTSAKVPGSEVALAEILKERRLQEEGLKESEVEISDFDDPGTLSPDPKNIQWSSLIAGFSQYGYPLAHQMRLTAWVVDVSTTEAGLSTGAWAALLPHVRGFKKPVVEAEGDAPVRTFRATYEPVEDGLRPLVILVDAVLLDENTVPVESASPFLQVPQAPGREVKNWRKEFPARAGDALDLYALWLAGAAPQLASGNMAVDVAKSLRVFALVLAHDHCGYGLFTPSHILPAPDSAVPDHVEAALHAEVDLPAGITIPDEANLDEFWAWYRNSDPATPDLCHQYWGSSAEALLLYAWDKEGDEEQSYEEHAGLVKRLLAVLFWRDAVLNKAIDKGTAEQLRSFLGLHSREPLLVELDLPGLQALLRQALIRLDEAKLVRLLHPATVKEWVADLKMCLPEPSGDDEDAHRELRRLLLNEITAPVVKTEMGEALRQLHELTQNEDFLLRLNLYRWGRLLHELQTMDDGLPADENARQEIKDKRERLHRFFSNEDKKITGIFPAWPGEKDRGALNAWISSLATRIGPRLQESGRLLHPTVGQALAAHFWPQLTQALASGAGNDLAKVKGALKEAYQSWWGRTNHANADKTLRFWRLQSVTEEPDKWNAQLARLQSAGLISVRQETLLMEQYLTSLVMGDEAAQGTEKQAGKVYGIVTDHGESKAAPVMIQPPLLLAPPTRAGGVSVEERNRGLVVFARRGAHVETSVWHCLTYGVLRCVLNSGEKFHLHKPGNSLVPLPVPWQFVQSLDIQQNFVEFRERPLGVRTHDLDVLASGSEDALNPSHLGLDLFYERVSALHEGWGAVPGLRYRDGREYYDFVFSLLDNSGALPRQLAQTLAGKVHPGLMAAATVIRPLLDAEMQKTNGQPSPDGLAGEQASHCVQRTGPFRRRVNVGQLRFASSELGSLKLPVIPKTIMPLAEDLWGPEDMPDSANKSAFLRSTYNNFGVTRPQTVLLSPEERAGFKKGFTFVMRPPAIEFENWKYWLRGEWPDEANQADLRKAIINTEVKLMEAKLEGNGDPAQMLNDPAVRKIRIRWRKIWSFETGQTAEGWESADIAVEGFHTNELLENISATTASIEVSHEFIKVNGQTKSWGGKGTITQVQFIPLISKQAAKRFSQILPTLNEDGGNLPVDAAFVPLMNARSEWRVEVLPTAAQWRAQWNRADLRQVLWNNFKLQRSSKNQRLEIVYALSDTPSLPHASFHQAIIEIQPWRWNGLSNPNWEPADLRSKLQSITRQSGQGATDLPLAMPALIDAEARLYAGRSDKDAREETATVNFAPFILKRGAEPQVLFAESGDAETLPRYHRALLRVRGRYHGLGGSFATEISTKGELPSHDGKEWASYYKRCVIPGRPKGQLQPPRIKLVIPVFETLEGENRPGFLVLARETLKSPFHRLEVLLPSTSVWQAAADSTPSNPKSQLKGYIAEVGADPLEKPSNTPWTVAMTNDPPGTNPPPPPDWMLEPSQAIGLTYERESGSPLFPNAAFSCSLSAVLRSDPAQGTVQQLTLPATQWKNTDLFVKLKFRWAIDPPFVLDEQTKPFRGPETLPWQVRLLSSFMEVPVAGGSGLQKLDGDVTFSFEEGPKVRLKTSTIAGGRLVQALPQVSNQPLVEVLMLVTWGQVQDALHPAPSKIFQSLHAWWPGQGTVADTLIESGPQDQATHGQFLLVHVHESRLPGGAEWKGPNNQKLVERLFGVKEDDDEIMDASGLIVRPSTTILRS